MRGGGVGREGKQSTEKGQTGERRHECEGETGKWGRECETEIKTWRREIELLEQRSIISLCWLGTTQTLNGNSAGCFPSLKRADPAQQVHV